MTLPSIARTIHCGQALLPSGWARDVRIAIADGRIARIEQGRMAAGDEHAAIVLPGLPNLHSHAFQRGLAGLAEVRGPSEDSFWTWREVMYRFLDRIGPDELRAIAALAYLEMLEGGFTRVGEFHYLHHDRDGQAFAAPAEMAAAIAAAAEETGIALTLLPVFYAHAGFGGAEPQPAQRRFTHDRDGFAALIADIGRLHRALPDLMVGVAPHSLRAVTPDELALLADLLPDAPFHIHVAEQQAEVDACLAWSGARPVEWLLDHAAVDRRWCLVHATHMTDREADRMAATGAVAGLCPITEANLGDGLFNAAPFLAAGGAFGIGSDSNVMIDATEELRLLEYGQRLQHRGRNLFARAAGRSTGEDVYRSALDGGARALGVATGIAPGHAADLVSIDAAHPSLIGRDGAALLDGLLFAAGRSAIDRVWRGGRCMVAGGRHIARDRIVARYRTAIAGILT